jgi:predicted glycosyltransferase
MRDLGHRDVWENCYYSTYDRDKALRYGEDKYCYHGELYYVHNNRKVDPARGVCRDLPKCKGLNYVVLKGSKRTG